MADLVSVVIPNRNGAATIGRCLEAVCASRYPRFEVIVVDDASEDGSVEIIEKFPCALVRLAAPAGAAKARNVGAAASAGRTLFFTDADCLVREDTLAIGADALAEAGADTIVGGTYTPLPGDPGFFSTFQSVFVNYHETRKAARPDYLATHAMAIDAATFRKHGGFAEDFLPILEDVEFSHRLRRAGCRLIVVPSLQVRHLFGFSLVGSIRNAARKSRYWTAYSLGHGDLLGDSGTASAGLKANVAAYGLTALLVALALASGRPEALLGVPGVVAANLLLNRGLIGAFRRAAGPAFAAAAALYYVGLYPLPVGAGALAGAVRSLRGRPARTAG